METNTNTITDKAIIKQEYEVLFEISLLPLGKRQQTNSIKPANL